MYRQRYRSGERLARAPLRVELGGGHPQTDEAREHRLVEARILLERLVLDDGRQLVVVADQHDALEPALPRRGVDRL